MAALGDTDLSRALNELPDVVAVIDDGGHLLWANRTAECLFGRSLDGSVGLSGLDLVHPEDLEFVLRSLESVQHKVVGSPIELRLRTPSGWKLMELIGCPVPWVQPGSILTCIRDLTERRRFEISHDADSRFRTLVQCAPVLTLLVSTAGIIESCSGAMTRLLGHDSDLVEGEPLADLVVEPDRPAIGHALREASERATTANPVTVTVRVRHHGNGFAIPFELSFVNLVDDPTVAGFVVSGHDVTDRVRLEEQLGFQAFHDPLTGLGNRALFHEQLQYALDRTRRNGLQIAVLFLDLDDFKLVNDEFGHAAGDEVLRTVGHRLIASVRASDRVARLGGDEFGIIPEFVTYQRALTTLANKVLGQIRTPIRIDAGAEVSVQASLGVVVGSGDSTEEQLLHAADHAMYQAKSHGGDRFEVVRHPCADG